MGGSCSKPGELRLGGGTLVETSTSASAAEKADQGYPGAPGDLKGGKQAAARKGSILVPRARGEPPALAALPPGRLGGGVLGTLGASSSNKAERNPPSAGELLGWAPLLRRGAEPGAPRNVAALGPAPRGAEIRESLHTWPHQGTPGLLTELAVASGGFIELPSPSAAAEPADAPLPLGVQSEYLVAPELPCQPASPRPAPPRAPAPGVSGSEVHVCFASGTASWACAGAICSQQASGGALASAPFRLPGTGSHAVWRLVWVPEPGAGSGGAGETAPPLASDGLKAGAGLFLECVSPMGGGDAPLLVRFSLGLVPCHAPAARADLVHAFSRRAPAWGLPASALEPSTLPPGFVDALRSGGRDGTPPVTVLLRAALAAEVSNLLDLPDWLPAGGAPGGYSLAAERVSTEPRVFVIENFLTSAECAALRALAGPDLVRSRVSSGTETASRTSRGTFLTGAKEAAPIVLRLESRIAACIAQPALRAPDVPGGPTRLPLRRSEALQVVHYSVGQFYHEHYDNKAGNAAARAASFLVYLADVPEGGATYFPRSSGRPPAANGPLSRPPPGSPGDPNAPPLPAAKPDGSPPGLRIYPREGRAIVFWSRTAGGHEDGASIHSAETVLGGEKWIVTRWLREDV